LLYFYFNKNTLDSAFKEYSKNVLKAKPKKPSIAIRLEKFKNIAEGIIQKPDKGEITL